MISMFRPLVDNLGFNPLAWLRDTRRMRKLVKDFEIPCPIKQDSVRFAVVVTPWLGTAVPWFSLVCGLFLRARGCNVTFIVDDIPFGGHLFRFRVVVYCLRSVLRVASARYDILSLRDFIGLLPVERSARQAISSLAELNAVWALRGEMSQVGRQRTVAEAARQLSASYSAIEIVLRDGKYDVISVPGGVWGSSGIWVKHARAAGVRIATFDSGGYGTLMLAANGVACQLGDIPAAFSMLKTTVKMWEVHAFIVESARAEIERRRAGVDKFASQIPGIIRAETRASGAVLIALNSSWDSAALGLHAVFENSMQWVVESVKYVLENSSVPVIVRQHPAERLEIARTSDDYRRLLNDSFGSHPRLRFIAAEDPVNSYDLLDEVAVVLVYTSTIGIEAAAHGKVVITPSFSYYSDLGFVWKATDRSRYRKCLSEALAGLLVVSPSMRDDAIYCYYLTQCCNWVFSPFNPEGFEEWSRFDLSELGQHEKVEMTMQALEGNIPVAYLNHLAQFDLRVSKS